MKMFKIFTKLMSEDEIRILFVLWDEMCASFKDLFCMGKKHCDDCPRKRLCKGLNKTHDYLKDKISTL